MGKEADWKSEVEKCGKDVMRGFGKALSLAELGGDLISVLK